MTLKALPWQWQAVQQEPGCKWKMGTLWNRLGTGEKWALLHVIQLDDSMNLWRGTPSWCAQYGSVLSLIGSGRIWKCIIFFFLSLCLRSAPLHHLSLLRMEIFQSDLTDWSTDIHWYTVWKFAIICYTDVFLSLYNDYFNILSVWRLHEESFYELSTPSKESFLH